MSRNATHTHNDCPSCLRRNEPDMNFCMYCGTALKADMEHKRFTDLKLLKPCIKCGKADKLSQEFCVYCGTQITVPGASQPESSAFKKFTWELEKIESAADNVRREVASVSTSVDPPKTKGAGLNWTALLSVLGLILGSATCYFLGREYMQRVYLQLTWPRDGIVVYVDPPSVTYRLYERGSNSFIVGKSSDAGSFSINGVKPGSYTLHVSSPKHRTIIRRVNVEEGRTTVLGYPQRLLLPAQES